MSCRCAPALVALRSEINARWPQRDKASDGCCGDAAHAARKSDHNADASGYAHAHDFDEGIASGDRPLWDTLLPIVLADDRTKYVIYERRIMYPDGTNKPYTGPNAHAHHLHLSIKSTATHDTRRWLPEGDEVTDQDIARIVAAVVPAVVDQIAGPDFFGNRVTLNGLAQWVAKVAATNKPTASNTE